MPSQLYNQNTLKKEIASHSDTLLQMDDLLKRVIDHFERGNRSALVLQCNFILSQCTAQLSDLERIHTMIQDDPDMRISDMLLTQQSSLYTEYADIARGLLYTLQEHQVAEQRVKETHRQLEAQLLQIRLNRKKVDHGQ